MRKRGISDRARDRSPPRRRLLAIGLPVALGFLVLSAVACGGTSSETPYPREPLPRDSLETGTGGKAPS